MKQLPANPRYAWNPAARLSGDAQKVGEKIEEIRKEHGTISPKQVVQAAKPKGSLLHSYFMWDNDKAAAAYREQQAGYLLRSIVIVHEPTNINTRAFVSIKVAEQNIGEGTYTNVQTAFRKYKKELLKDALRDLDIYRRKYNSLSTLATWSSSLSTAREELIAAIET